MATKVEWNIYENKKPEKDGRYLTCNVNGSIAITAATVKDGVVDFYRKYSSITNHIDKKEPSKTIFAWCELPDVPKELKVKPTRELLAEIDRLKAELKKYKNAERERG